MPQCRNCSIVFSGPYRQKYCSVKCQFLSRVPAGLPPSECWDWQGARSKAGYGVLNATETGLRLAHRMAYALFVGQIPDGRYICHKCDNPACVNPAHLFAGTNADNMRDMAEKGRAAWAKRPMPPEVRAKAVAARKATGWTPSEAHREAVRQAMSKRWADPASVESFRSKMSGASNPNFGKKMSDEQREKLRPYWEAGGNAVGRKPSAETKEKIRQAHKARAEAGLVRKGYTHTDAAKENMRQASIKREAAKRLSR